MHEIIRKNTDLKRLLDEGYSVSIENGHLYIRNIPTLNHLGNIVETSISSSLELSSDNFTIKPGQHIVHIEEIPYQFRENSIIQNTNFAIALNQNVNGMNLHQLSRKPPNGYEDYYQKMTTYINILVESVSHINPHATARKFINANSGEVNTNLQHFDTNSSRANIFHLNDIFIGQKIAIIGIGGTGSYILDLVSRVPVEQIDLFDDDIYANHNYFRSPGNIIPHENETKCNVFAKAYSNRHLNIQPHGFIVDETNLSMLDNYNFIFICIDNVKSRKMITDNLNERNLSYIDSGIGMINSNNKLLGNVRISNSISLPENIEGDENDIYKINIQIAELNSLAASLSVIEWKKRIWYYHHLKTEQEIVHQIT